jgi:hypothetical protein
VELPTPSSPTEEEEEEEEPEEEEEETMEGTWKNNSPAWQG